MSRMCRSTATLPHPSLLGIPTLGVITAPKDYYVVKGFAERLPIPPRWLIPSLNQARSVLHGLSHRCTETRLPENAGTPRFWR